MIFALLMGCLYDQSRLDWIYTQLRDDDGDTFREIDEDCDDQDPEVHPGAYELCDGIDNDCNGDADGDALDIRPWYQDSDQDNFGTDAVTRLSCTPVPTYASVGGDCNDQDDTVYPDAEIVCGENEDRNCDGKEDNLDQDQDGYPYCADCGDLDQRVHPGAPERCNQLDDDCDGEVDGPEAHERAWYPDEDQDGYGATAEEILSCDPEEDYIIQGGDCDDKTADINPAATEICFSGVDENCDGVANNCSWTGSLASNASFIGTSDIGLGRDSVLNAMLNAGDMDGDGYDELAFANNGLVVLQHGPFSEGTLPITTGAFVTVQAASSTFGLVTSAIGDVDGDLKDDLGIGDPTFGTGVVYLLRTETGAQTSNQLMALSAPTGAYPFGLGIARDEDTLFVNAADMSSSASTLYATTLPLVEGEQPNWTPVLQGDKGILALSPYFLDANGDGVRDLGSATVNFQGNSRTNNPEFCIFFGPLVDQSTSEADIVYTNDTGFALFPGLDLSPGDMTGDGLDDLWLVPGAYTTREDDGLLWLVPPTTSGTAQERSVATITGDADDDEFTNILSRDLNSDSQIDLLLGMPWASTQPDDGSGSVRLLYGPFLGTKDSNLADATFGGNPGSWTGRWLATGSFRHLQDIAILAPGDQNASASDSRVDLIWDGL